MSSNKSIRLESMLLEVLDSTPDCFAIMSPDGTIFYCNTVFADIYGIDKSQVEGKNNQDLLRHAWQNKKGVKIETDDFDLWYKNLTHLHKSLTLNQFETDLTDGRWFKMTRINLSNGYIMTFGTNITELKETQKNLEDANKCLEKVTLTDHLTGVYNRRALEIYSEKEISRAQRYNNDLSLLVLDIDFFKKTNDTYGHEGGDDLLKEFARIAYRSLRASDSLYRIGGEEFVILLPHTSLDDAKVIGDRIRSLTEEHPFRIQNSDTTIQVTISVGISVLLRQEKTLKGLLHRADTALYQAKSRGRNTVVTEQEL